MGKKGNMLVVGDSMNHEIFWILMNHLVVNKTRWKSVPMGAGQRHTREELEVCQDVLGGQGIRVGFVRNDRLSLIQGVNEDSKHNFMGYPWINFVEAWTMSVFLLNRGAHFESDANFTESLTNAFAVIKMRWPQALVSFRNTPGHINCMDHNEPLKERESYETLNKYARGYHWAEFAHQNEIAKNVTERFGFI